MSRIGKKPIAIPSEVTVTVAENVVTVKGSKGELTLQTLPEVTVKVDGSQVIVERKGDEREARARHGLTRALIANMIEGVNKGYEKRLEIIGVGYKAQGKGKSVTLHLGFSKPIEYKVSEGVEVKNDEGNKLILVVTGIDKQLVGQVSADLRALRPPEPYKGKGIRYLGEEVKRKVGKAAMKTEGAGA